MRPFCTALNTEVDDTVSSWKLSLPRRAVRDYPSVGLTESKIWKTRRETRTTPSYSPIRTPNSSLAHELDTDDLRSFYDLARPSDHAAAPSRRRSRLRSATASRRSSLRRLGTESLLTPRWRGVDSNCPVRDAVASRQRGRGKRRLLRAAIGSSSGRRSTTRSVSRGRQRLA